MIFNFRKQPVLVRLAEKSIQEMLVSAMPKALWKEHLLDVGRAVVAGKGHTLVEGPWIEKQGAVLTVWAKVLLGGRLEMK